MTTTMKQKDSPAEVSENPYADLSISPDLSKYGPRTFLRFLLKAISASYPNDFELRGLPGAGKSTLLKYMAALLENIATPQEAVEPYAASEEAVEPYKKALLEPYQSAPYRLFPVLVEFRLAPEVGSPWTYVYDRFQKEYLDYRQRVNSFWKEKLPDFSQEPQGLEDLTPDKRADESRLAIDRLDQCIGQLSEIGVRAVFLLDDFDLAFKKMDFDEIKRMRPLRDQSCYLMVTERESLSEARPLAVGSPFFSALQTHYVSLTEDEARNLIEGPAAGSPFHEADIRLVLQHAGRHLYLLLLAAQELWNLRERQEYARKEEQVDQQEGQLLAGKHFKIFVARLRQTFHSTFQLYWEMLEDGERSALQVIRKNDTVSDDKYLTLVGLVEKGLVKLSPGKTEGLTLFSPIFEQFIDEKLSDASLDDRSRHMRTPPSEANLTATEVALYTYLQQHPNQVCSFAELWQHVWKEEVEEQEMKRRLQVSISRLRTKLKEQGREGIFSVRDRGYRLVP